MRKRFAKSGEYLQKEDNICKRTSLKKREKIFKSFIWGPAGPPPYLIFVIFFNLYILIMGVSING